MLAAYGLTHEDSIARGMEAEVYNYGTDAVLKLYHSAAPLLNLYRLQSFYASLDRSQLSYAVPAIQHIAEAGRYRVVIEARLGGYPLATLLSTTPHHRLDALFDFYAQAVLELATISMPSEAAQYKLFDSHQLSLRWAGDWHVFLQRWLEAQQTSLEVFFTRDVADYRAKLAHMTNILRQPYLGTYRLIHGDICPSNMLVAAGGQPQALLDFGLYTMYGDPLFDAATAWVFFDMYDELHANIRERLLAVFLERLGEQARAAMYRYVLLYSLLSANAYAADCSDGHYAWCVANLNTHAYWESCA